MFGEGREKSLLMQPKQRATRQPQKQLKKNRKMLHALKRRGGEIVDKTDGRKDAKTKPEAGRQTQAGGICNWEEMPAEKSSLTDRPTE